MKTTRRVLFRRLSMFLLPMLAASMPINAQDVTHPQRMDLPEPGFERPSPDSLRMVLDNGLAIYLAEDHRAPLVSMSAYIGVGSGHGAPGEAAALAAALRRGPASLAPGGFQDALDGMSADFEVRQDHEETEVHLDVPLEDMSEALTLLGKLLQSPAFAGPDGKGSKPKVVVGGIDYNYSLDTAVHMFMAAQFSGHAFKREVSSRQRSAAVASGAAALHQRYVVARNITLAIAGDFKRGKAKAPVSAAFAGISDEAAPAREAFAPLPGVESRQLLLATADRGQGWVVIGHELPVVPTDDEAALAVMDYILGAYHLDSRLYRQSRELRGLTNDNSSFLRPGVRGPGTYSFRTYGRPEAVQRLIDITFRELETMRSTLPDETELFVAKGALVDGIYAERYATGLDASQAYAREWLRWGDHSRSASYPQRIRQVTAADVQAAAKKYIHPERMTVAVLGPLQKIRSAPQVEGEPSLDSWGN